MLQFGGQQYVSPYVAHQAIRSLMAAPCRLDKMLTRRLLQRAGNYLTIYAAAE